MRFRGDVVVLQLRGRSGDLWGRRELFWRIELKLLVDVRMRPVELADGRQLRRTLVDADSGEVLDDVWIGRDGRVRSQSKGRADPPAAGERVASRAAVDRSPEAGTNPQDRPPPGAECSTAACEELHPARGRTNVARSSRIVDRTIAA